MQPTHGGFIEVVGEYDPAVTTNITSTAITDASIGQTMQTLDNAGQAVLYGDDHSSGTPASNSGGTTTGGGTVTGITLSPLKPANTVEYDVTVANGKFLIDGDLLETLDLEKEKPIDLINPTECDTFSKIFRSR